MEKIRELVTMLQAGIEDYDNQLKVLQQERLKFIRLSIANGFGADENSSKDSWLLHLKQLEDSLEVRLTALKQGIKKAADEIIAEGS